MNSAFVIVGLLLVWLLYAAFVIRLMYASGQYEERQLIMQSLLVLVLPVVGALFVHVMYLATRSNQPKPDRHHAEQDDQVGVNPSARPANLED
jgi:hypothetical protein